MHFSCEGGVCMHACGGERRKKTSATILRQCQAHTYAAKVQMHFRIYKNQVLYLLVLAPVDKLWNVRRRTEIISCEKCAWEIKVSKYCLAPCPPKRLRKWRLAWIPCPRRCLGRRGSLSPALKKRKEYCSVVHREKRGMSFVRTCQNNAIFVRCCCYSQKYDTSIHVCTHILRYLFFLFLFPCCQFPKLRSRITPKKGFVRSYHFACFEKQKYYVHPPLPLSSKFLKWRLMDASFPFECEWHMYYADRPTPSLPNSNLARSDAVSPHKRGENKSKGPLLLLFPLSIWLTFLLLPPSSPSPCTVSRKYQGIRLHIRQK